MKLTSQDGIDLLPQLRWDLASLRGAIHPSMWATPPTHPVRRVYHYHVRKSAGTSLVFAFFAANGEDPMNVERRLVRRHFTSSGPHTFVEHDKRLIGRGRYTFASSHLPAWDLHVPPDTYTVTVVRDPIRRLLSLYAYLADPDSDAGYPFRAPVAQRAWAADGFGAFLDRVPPFHLRNHLHMFSEHGDIGEAEDRLRSVSWVLRTEHLSEDTANLAAALGQPLVLRRERAGATVPELTSGELDRAAELVAPEYDLLRRVGAL